MKRKVPAIGSIIMIAGGIVMVMAVLGLAASLSGVIEDTYLSLALHTPGFEYKITQEGEVGNETFDAYVQMRTIGLGVMTIALIYAGVARVMESTDTQMVRPGTSNKILSKSLMFLLLFLVFPVFWDGLSDGIENVSMWVLNPNYSFDPDRPCPDDWYDDPDRIFTEYKKSNYVTELQKSIYPFAPTISENNTGAHTEFERVCRPELKVNYVFGQMLRQTEVGQPDGTTSIVDEDTTRIINDLEIDDGIDWAGKLTDGIQQGSSNIFTNVFLGLTKSLVSIQVLIMAMLIGIMTDMLVGMVIAGLPIFLMLTLIPKGEEIANKFIEAIPALLMIPLMSAIILSVGAGAIFETPATTGEGGLDTIYVWITAVGVVFFAVTLPVLMVPLLKGVTQMAQQTVSSAISSSAMVTGTISSGVAAGAIKGHRSGGGLGSIIKSGLKGGGGGIMNALPSGMPSGIGMPNPNQMANSMKQVRDENIGDLPSRKDQENNADVVNHNEDATKHTEQNQDAMYKQGIGKGYDSKESKEKNEERGVKDANDANNNEAIQNDDNFKDAKQSADNYTSLNDLVANDGIKTRAKFDEVLSNQLTGAKESRIPLAEGVAAKHLEHQIADNQGISVKQVRHNLDAIPEDK